VPAGIGASMLIVGFVMGRLTAPAPASPSKTVSEHAPAEVVAAPLKVAAAAEATAAPPAATEAPSAPASAPQLPANQPDPEPAKNPTMAAAQGNTAPYKSWRQAAPVRPGPAARRGDPGAAPPSPTVDSFVQAVKQSISEDQASQKGP
jgi:hypothetical protein